MGCVVQLFEYEENQIQCHVVGKAQVTVAPVLCCAYERYYYLVLVSLRKWCFFSIFICTGGILYKKYIKCTHDIDFLKKKNHFRKTH